MSFLVHRFAYKLTSLFIVGMMVLSTSAAFRSRKERPKGAKKVDGNWRVFVDQCPHRKGEMHICAHDMSLSTHRFPFNESMPSTEEIVCIRMSYVFYCHCLLI